MVRIFLLALTIQDGQVTDCFLNKLSSFLLWVRITGLTEPLNLSLNNEIKQLFSKKLNFAQMSVFSLLNVFQRFYFMCVCVCF